MKRLTIKKKRGYIISRAAVHILAYNFFMEGNEYRKEYNRVYDIVEKALREFKASCIRSIRGRRIKRGTTERHTAGRRPTAVLPVVPATRIRRGNR
jgi:hypothetical protein